jgi:hypothetical protein
MDPLRVDLTPLHQRRGVRFLQRRREGGSQRESDGGKEKDDTFFEDPTPKINLIEAHLNRPSLQEKETIAHHQKREAKTPPRLPFERREWWSLPPTSR